MTTFLGVLTLLVTMATTNAGAEQVNQNVAQPPSHQVVALYFHRTQRCPTCKRIGSLAEEAITKGFPGELRSKIVDFRLIDFQQKKNTQLAKQYKVNGPTLVLQNVLDGKVVSWTPMPKIWQLIGKPLEFHAYVQQQVAKYLKQDEKEAEPKQ